MVDYPYIEKLLSLATIDIDWDRIEYIDKNWNEFTEIEYYAIISNLKQSQLDPITSGQNYNQTDILKHINKLK